MKLRLHIPNKATDRQCGSRNPRCSGRLGNRGAVRTVSRNIENNGGFEMGVNSVNDAGSAYGAAFRNKPVYFMTGKETEAFF